MSELMAKGVSREIIDTVLAERPEDAQLTQARAAIRKPLARWAALDPADRRRRAQAYLLGRGFGYDTIAEVLAHPEEEGGAEQA